MQRDYLNVSPGPSHQPDGGPSKRARKRARKTANEAALAAKLARLNEIAPPVRQPPPIYQDQSAHIYYLETQLQNQGMYNRRLFNLIVMQGSRMGRIERESADYKRRLNMCESDVNALYQYGMRTKVDIVGLFEEQLPPNIEELLQKLFNDLGIAIDVDTQVLTIAPTYKSTGGRTVSHLILELDTYEAANEVLRKRGQRIFEGRTIYINQMLTSWTCKLFSEVKKRAIEMGWKYYWIKDSEIFCRKVDGARVVTVASFNDLHLIK